MNQSKRSNKYTYTWAFNNQFANTKQDLVLLINTKNTVGTVLKQYFYGEEK